MSYNKKKKMEAGGRTKRKAQAISYDFAGNPINVPQDYNSFYNTQQPFQPLPLNVGGGQVVTQGLNTPETFLQAPNNFIGPPPEPNPQSYSFNPDGTIRLNTDYLLQAMNGGVRGQDAYGTYGRNTNRKYANEGLYGARRDLNDVSIFENGGSLTPSKAKKILEDGVINGKKISEKQRKYFGAISSRKDGGGIGNAQEQKQWLGSYLNSPKYKERLQKEYGKSDVSRELEERQNNLNNIKTIYTKTPIGNQWGSVSGLNTPYIDNKNRLDPNTHEPFIKTGDKYPRGSVALEREYRPNNFRPAEGFETIPLHEYGHGIDDGGRLIPAATMSNIANRVDMRMTEEVLGNKFNIDKPAVEYNNVYWKSGPDKGKNVQYSYTEDPTEFINRIQPIRYLLDKQKIYDTKTQDFNESHYNKMMSNPGIKKNVHFQDVMKSIKGDTEKDKMNNFIWFMNNIAKEAGGQNQGVAYAQNGWSNNPFQDPNQLNYGSSQAYMDWMSKQQAPQQLQSAPIQQMPVDNMAQGQPMQGPPPGSQGQQQQSSNAGSMAGGIQMGAEAIGGLFSGYNHLRNQVILGGSALLNGLLPDQHNIRNKSPLMADQTLAYQPQFNNMMENGGNIQSPGMVINTAYQPGQTLELSPEEVQKLREAGYDFEVL